MAMHCLHFLPHSTAEGLTLAKMKLTKSNFERNDNLHMDESRIILSTTDNRPVNE